MNGERVVIDTNILVDYAKGVEAMKHVVEGVEAHISIITEIEFLSWSGLTDDRIADARLFLNESVQAGSAMLSVIVRHGPSDTTK